MPFGHPYDNQANVLIGFMCLALALVSLGCYLGRWRVGWWKGMGLGAFAWASFVAAVIFHALHNLAVRNAIGLNPLMVAATWIGVVVIVVVIIWSLHNQRQWLVTELVGEVPDEVYQSVTARGQGLWIGERQARHLYQQCAELATKKAQHKRRPDEPELLEEIERLRKVIKALVGGEE